MSRKKKITDELKPQIAEALRTKSRTQVCKDFGVSYEMLRKTFGAKWKHVNGESVKLEDSIGPA